jgi:hypothetical protein
LPCLPGGTTDRSSIAALTAASSRHPNFVPIANTESMSNIHKEKYSNMTPKKIHENGK